MAATPHPTLAILLIAWFNQWFWWLLLGPLLLILLLFPTGRPPSPRWRWVIVAVAVLFGIFLLVSTLKASFEVPNTNVRLRNPLGILPESAWTIVAVPWIMVLLTTVTLNPSLHACAPEDRS
jgi:two-component system NarL family sensor kinase